MASNQHDDDAVTTADARIESPEHGGIGSTEFSSHTVAEEGAEVGLDPDATPFVQTLVVLKKLLAQRKLNESYFGGFRVLKNVLLLSQIPTLFHRLRLTPFESISIQSTSVKIGEIGAVAQNFAKNGNSRSQRLIRN